MPSVSKTANYNLNQWAGNEYPKREDFNADNLAIDTQLKANADAAAAKETPASAQSRVDTHAAVTGTTLVKGHLQLGTTADKAAAGNHNHSGVYEPVDAHIMRKDVAQTMAAQLTALNDTNYTSFQTRNIAVGTDEPGVLANGVIYFVREA